MKTKSIHFLKIILPLFVIIFCVVVYSVKANEKLTIIDFKYYSGHPSNGILYSNNSLLLWGEYGPNTTIENVKKFDLLYGGNLAYLTHDNKFYDTDMIHENIVDYAFSGDAVVGDVAYKDVNDNLYVRDIGSNWNSSFVSYEEKLIATNVKNFILVDHWSCSTLLYTTNDNKLHALGVNYFGTKINEGNDFTEIYDLLDNIKSFTQNYAISNDGKLYYFSSNSIKPTVIYDDVNDIIMISSEREKELYYIEKTDGTYTVLHLQKDYDDGSIISINDINIDFKAKDAIYDYVLSDDGKLYKIDVTNKNYSLVDENVKEISLTSNEGYSIYEPVFYILYENNELYHNVTSEDGSIGNDFIKALTHQNKFYGKTKILSNVESIKYLEYNLILLTDGSVLRYGSNQYNAFKNPDLPSSYIPIKIDESINDGKEIKSLEVILGDTGITNITLDDELDYYATVVPYNAIDRDVVWSSSDENILTVDNSGYIKAVGIGTATVCIALKSNSNMKDCTAVSVHPKVSSVEITNGDSIDAELYEKVLLTAKVLPEEAIDQEVVWSVESNNIYLSSYDYSNNGELPNNQIYATVQAGGSYKVTVTTKNGLYSDSININTVERVSNIELDIDYDNFDGINNAFIYLSESNTLQVGYNIYPTTATNQNVTWSSSAPEIVTVDSTGKITAYKTGRARITIKSLDGGAERTFNVLVYDYNSENIVIGDVNGDGVVNILDLIKMRNYLAGLEDSL